jgi:cysteinyl-tRNA synthetase, unknown class
MRRFAALLALLCASFANAKVEPMKLNQVDTWLLLLNNDLTPPTVRQIANSNHDMVVVDYLPSQPHHAAYPIRETVAALKLKPSETRRFVMAYLNVGQAEDYRAYWRKGWKVGAPDWILMNDPDGWAGNFPVAYWRPGWREIVTSLAQDIARAGFDGVYLDWVGGFQEDTVQKAAAKDGVHADEEMAKLVQAVGEAGRAINPDFHVIGQNAAPLLANPRYLAAIDAVAHESVWFTWGGKALGDCPIPRTEAEASSAAFRASLPPACRAAYDKDPGSAMRFAGESYLVPLLKDAQVAGKTIFTVDYAQAKRNRLQTAQNSRALGFVPFIGSKELKLVEPPAP